jgi:hypothetical protein
VRGLGVAFRSSPTEKTPTNFRAIGDGEAIRLSLSSNPVRGVTPMQWMEILMLTVGVALIVTMICTGRRA